MKRLQMLKELKELKGSKNKEGFISKHKTNSSFVSLLKFILNPLIVTGIGEKRYKKVDSHCFTKFEDLDHVLQFMNTMEITDNNIASIKKFVNLLPENNDIAEKIVCNALKLGIGAKGYNNVVELYDEIFLAPYMGCKSYTKKLIQNFKYPAYCEVKNDGMYTNAYITEKPFLQSRSGHLQTIEGPLLNVLKRLRKHVGQDMVLNGELMLEGFERKTANGIIASLIETNEDGSGETYKDFYNNYQMTTGSVEDKLYIIAWDVIPLDEFLLKKGISDRQSRLKLLEDTLNAVNTRGSIIQTGYEIVNSKEEAMKVFKDYLVRGEEGAVLKTFDGKWKDGKPSYQVKMKLEMKCTLKIVGYKEGKNKYKHNLGSLILESYDGIVKTAAAGVSDALRKKIWDNQASYLYTLVDVKCNGISEDKHGNKSLLYARFDDFRHDLDKADNFDEIKDNEIMAMSLK